MSKTVIQHVLSRLSDNGVKDVFGVPGDYAFPINDAVCSDPNLRWIGSCNELNAAYSADGYARIRGVAAACTTYAVGELSAINGIGGLMPSTYRYFISSACRPAECRKRMASFTTHWATASSICSTR